MGVAYQGVPTIFKNSVMVGAATGEYVPLGTAGNSRAFDARTGAKLWEFHSVLSLEKRDTKLGKARVGKIGRARTRGASR